jgi:diguanylate cyclase (GGDEF)-like protein
MQTFTRLGEFSDAEAERTFQAARWPETRKRMRAVGVISALAYASGLYLDYSILGAGPDFAVMASARLSVCLVGLCSLFFTCPSSCTARGLGWALGVYMLSILLCEAGELVMKSGRVDVQGIPSSVVILLTFYFVLPPKANPTILGSVLGSVVFVFVMATQTWIPDERVINVALFYALANGFGIVLLIRFGLAHRREFQSLAQLKRLAEIDELTQVLSRRRVLELGQRMLNEAKRYGEPLSIMLLDIDHFKAINDRFGHAGGDVVLREAARRCMDQLREVDLFGRIGGEEFLAVLPHSDIQQAVVAADRLRRAVAAAPVAVDGGEVCVCFSIGVAQYSAATSGMDSLLNLADVELYRAKENGRNMVCACGEGVS